MRRLHKCSDSTYKFINPILDSEAPTSTGGTNEALALCKLLGIKLHLSPPRAIYDHGWGKECNQGKRIRCTSHFIVFDTQVLPTTIPFDLIRGSSLLIIGLDIKKYGDMKNMVENNCLIFRDHNTIESGGFSHTLMNMRIVTNEYGSI